MLQFRLFSMFNSTRRGGSSRNASRGVLVEVLVATQRARALSDLQTERVLG